MPNLLDSAVALLKNPEPDSSTWQAAAGAVVAAHAAIVENNTLRAATFRLLDAIRDAAVLPGELNFPAEVEEAYDTVAPIFGLPLLSEIEKAEDGNDAAALARLADMGGATGAAFPQAAPMSAPISPTPIA